MSDRNGDIYRLSDGRDARDILKELEALAEREAPLLASRNWVRRVFDPPSGWRFLEESHGLTSGLPGEDWQRVRDAAVEQWATNPPRRGAADLLESWYQRTAPGVHSGTLAGDLLVIFTEPLFRGWLHDGRTVETTAESFLAHVERLVETGVEEADAIRRGKTQVLGGLWEREQEAVVEQALRLGEKKLAPESRNADELDRSRYWRKAAAMHRLVDDKDLRR